MDDTNKELEEVIRKYLKNNLEVFIVYNRALFATDGTLTIKLKLDDRTISESTIEI
jgi:hypothetical protein